MFKFKVGDKVRTTDGLRVLIRIIGITENKYEIAYGYSGKKYVDKDFLEENVVKIN